MLAATQVALLHAWPGAEVLGVGGESGTTGESCLEELEAMS